MANSGNKKVRKVKNTGTIYFDNTTDQWVGQIEIGKYHNGRAKYKRFYGNSQNSVLEKMRIYKDNHEYEVLTNEPCNGSKDIVNKYFEVFLQSVKKSKLKPASFTREMGTFKNHISPYIGEYRLANLTASIIQNELINSLITKGYSFSTIHKAYVLLNEGLRYAYRQKIISNNPCDFVEEPSKKIFTNTKEIRFFNDNEIQSFINTVETFKNNKTHTYLNGLAIISLIYTGLRGGELMALQWSDVDFDKGYINVHRNIAITQDEQGKRIVLIQNSTKTKEKRLVYLSKSSKQYLKILKDLSLIDTKYNNGYVYITNGNRDLTSTEDTYKRICKKANIPNPQGVHTLRHHNTMKTHLSNLKYTNKYIPLHYNPFAILNIAKGLIT